MNIKLLRVLWIILFAIGSVKALFAETVDLQTLQQNRQQIEYWKPHGVLPHQDERVNIAHQIYTRLLLAWEGKQRAPRLLVVRDQGRAWAATLNGGNILMTVAAIDICLSLKQGNQDALAFILAHELAHQQAQDAWHTRAFRMAGLSQTTDFLSLQGSRSQDSEWLFQQKLDMEVRADHNALLFMSAVDFNPLILFSDTASFLTSWVEAVTRRSCQYRQMTVSVSHVCKTAQARTQQLHQKINYVALQSTLLILGNNAFITGRYDQAQRYFEAFSEDFKSAAVFSNLGLSYLAEAMHLMQGSIVSSQKIHVQLKYPVYLDTGDQMMHWLSQAKKLQEQYGYKQGRSKGNDETLDEATYQRVQQQLARAEKMFSHAMEYAPHHRFYLAYLITTHVMQSQLLSADALLKEKYQAQFGDDLLSQLLAALIVAAHGKTAEALSQLETVFLDRSVQWFQALDAKNRYVTYLGFQNMQLLSSLAPRGNSMADYGSIFSSYAITSEDTFNYYRAQLMMQKIAVNSMAERPSLHGFELGQRFIESRAMQGRVDKRELWVSGERFLLYQFTDEAYLLVNRNNRVIEAWQDVIITENNKSNIPVTLAMLKKTYGMPSRTLSVTGGDYFVYDSLGVATKVNNDQVEGWMLF